jgi:hypothetical protein
LSAGRTKLLTRYLLALNQSHPLYLSLFDSSVFLIVVLTAITSNIYVVLKFPFRNFDVLLYIPFLVLCSTMHGLSGDTNCLLLCQFLSCKRLLVQHFGRFGQILSIKDCVQYLLTIHPDVMVSICTFISGRLKLSESGSLRFFG